MNLECRGPYPPFLSNHPRNLSTIASQAISLEEKRERQQKEARSRRDKTRKERRDQELQQGLRGRLIQVIGDVTDVATDSDLFSRNLEVAHGSVGTVQRAEDGIKARKPSGQRICVGRGEDSSENQNWLL